MADDRQHDDEPPPARGGWDVKPGPTPSITKTSIPPAADVDHRDSTTIDRLAATRRAACRWMARNRQ